MSMSYWRPLLPGSLIDVIAPGGRFPPKELDHACRWIEQQGWRARVLTSLLGEDPFCANSLINRQEHLLRCLADPQSVALWAMRGGFGTAAAIEGLIGGDPSLYPYKICIGFSDITALHLVLNQHYGWPSIHGKVLMQCVEENAHWPSTQALITCLRSHSPSYSYSLVPLNEAAKSWHHSSASMLVGGNLQLLTNSIGTDWQIKTNKKFVFIEEVQERGYRVERSLLHLLQTGLVSQASAIIIGDVTEGYEADGRDLCPVAIERFAQPLSVAVFRVADIGHGNAHYPLILGVNHSIIRNSTGELVLSNCVVS
jgi:muramoyltetrapeptide carboxypeptidase